MLRRRLRIWLWLPLLVLAVILAVVWFVLGQRPLSGGRPAEKLGLPRSLNVLIVGRDARALNPAQDRGTLRIPREEISRSDVMVVCHVNLDICRVSLVSIPRDLLVPIPGHTTADRLDFMNLDKVNSAFAFGGEELLRRTLEEFLGIRIHRWIGFDFDSFRMTMQVLQPLLRGLRILDTPLADRDAALQLIRRRNNLRYDDLDRCRNGLTLLRAIVLRAWRFTRTRFGDALLSRVLSIVGPDTDLTRSEIDAVIAELNAGGFRPSSLETAVLVSEGRMLWLNRYGAELSVYLPHLEEIERQTDRFLRDRTDVRALDFMTQQHYHWPWYFGVNYDSVAGINGGADRTDTVPPDTTPSGSDLTQFELKALGLDTLLPDSSNR
ncbi:MAG: LCP family protein [candidate division WOR-3 bacterium]